MRKLTLLTLFFSLSLAGFCQSSPVHWEIRCEKLEANIYSVQVDANIDANWYVYAENNAELGVESVQLYWEHKKITKEGLLISAVPTNSVMDKIFGARLKVYQGRIELIQKINIEGKIPANFKVKVQAFAADGETFLTLDETIDIKIEGGISHAILLAGVDLNNPVKDCGDKTVIGESTNYIFIFWKGFAGGLIALLMPCIFPMLPVTVSFFMHRSETKIKGTKNGILYGSFIFLIYLAASLPFHLAGNIDPQIFNSISTNVWINLSFFLIFLLFALSLFGLFELRLPGANVTGKKGGIFFMALTLAIVSFSCTGPILGLLLVNAISDSNGAWLLTAGLAGFGLALALPFGLFAVFPQWLKKLPKSGGWMETLKKSLAFVELALAFKFLSNADMVEHWGLLKREVFVGIWAVITLAMAIYLFRQKMRIWGTVISIFAAYLLFSDLKLVSGFPPPKFYSIRQSPDGLEPDIINDYTAAIALSKKENKPLLVDFTGWACVNCRKMEEQVWTNDAVSHLIEDNFILVSLYVDDKAKVAEGGTVGERWAKFQADNFAAASQPQYVILSPDEKLLTNPIGYSSVTTYKDWLSCGIEAFEKNKP